VATGGECDGFVLQERRRYELQSEVAADFGMRGHVGGVQSSQAAEAFSDADPEIGTRDVRS
jgi:hypothetical protein